MLISLAYAGYHLYLGLKDLWFPIFRIGHFV